MSKLFLIIVLALPGCYRSVGTQLDAILDLEVDIADTADSENTADLQEDGETQEAIEYDSIPACEPAAVTNRLWEGCSDGIVQPGEECDDGNVLDGDGCTWDCLAGDGSGGVSGPSPLPLPRYCRIDGVYQVAELETLWPYGMIRYPILFWWTGAAYRVLYHDTRNGPSGERDQSFIRLISFDIEASSVEVLAESNHDYSIDLADFQNFFCHFSKFDSSMEVFCHHNFREAGYTIRNELLYMAINEGGSTIQAETILCFSPDQIFYPNEAMPRGNRTLLEDLGLPEIGMILTRNFPLIDLCRIQIVDPLLEADLTYAENRDGNYLSLYNATYHAFGGFLLAIPSSTQFPADLSLRPLCRLIDYPVPHAHNGNIMSTDEGFDLFFNCMNYSSEWYYSLIPFIAKVDENGGLAGAPTGVFNAGYLDEHMLETCGEIIDVDGQSAQLFGAVGSDTLGVFYIPFKQCGPERKWAPLFQTLDMEGRQVGEPCTAAVDYPPEWSGSYPAVVDVVWDGEGYAVAAVSDRGIYFWRYLPE